MSLGKAFLTYYTLFGLEGLLLGAKARLRRRPVEALIAVPGVAHPVCVRLATTDVSTLFHILLFEKYACDLANSPRVIVDAGANVGLTSLFYANRYPDAQIIAVEPEPSNYEVLKKNAARYRNIYPVHAALWRSDEDVSIVDPGRGHHCFQTFGTEGDGSGKITGHVPGVTMESLMKSFAIDHIDVLKVDIEGAEKEVFENAAPWIDKVDVLAIELHDRFKDGCAEAVRSVTTNFPVRWPRHETVFFAKAGSVAGDEEPAAKQPRRLGRARLAADLPLRIMAAV